MIRPRKLVIPNSKTEMDNKNTAETYIRQKSNISGAHVIIPLKTNKKIIKKEDNGVPFATSALVLNLMVSHTTSDEKAQTPKNLHSSQESLL